MDLSDVKNKNIIDETDPKLIAHLKALLPEAIRVNIAVGYFFISGFAEIMDSFRDLEMSKDPTHKIRLMISPSTNQATADVLLAANESIRDVKNLLENPEMSKEASLKRIKQDVESALGHMPQTGRDYRAAKKLVELMHPEKTKLEIGVYVKTKMHAKAYILEYPGGATAATSIVGSSNLSVSGIKDQLELSIKTSDQPNEKPILDWFERHWKECVPFTKEIADIIDKSWIALHTPKDVYAKALGHPIDEPVPPSRNVQLFKFQEDGFKRALQKINEYGGVIIADVVGTGKSYIGGALLSHLCSDGIRPLIICPPHLVDMWKAYARQFGVRNAAVVSRFDLGMDDDGEPKMDQYDDCNIILIDESHNFRYTNTESYRGLAAFMESRVRKTSVIMLTATPISNTVRDVKNQLALFPKESITSLPELEGSTLDSYFKGIEDPTTRHVTADGAKKIREILRHVMIRRTRIVIQEKYATKDGERFYLELGDKRKYIPEQNITNPKEYNPDNIYKNVYKGTDSFEDLMNTIGELNLARYAPGRYIKKEYLDDRPSNKPYRDLEHLTGSLLGIVRTSLLKRMESSIAAFDSTVKHYKTGSELFLEALENGTVPIGDRYSTDIYKYMVIEDDSEKGQQEDLDRIKKMLEEPSKYDINAFRIEEWKRAIMSDVEAFTRISGLTVDKKAFTRYDDKLRVLERIIEDNIDDGDYKLLIFSESSITVKYVHDHLKKYLKEHHVGKEEKITWIDSSRSRSEKSMIVRSFDTENNPPPKGKKNTDKYDILVSTDVLSEGMNLQAAKRVINYDFHWNPVRLLQRIGRINRIGSKFPEVDVINFLPTSQVEAHLGIREKVGNKIRTMRKIIGMGGGEILELGEIEPDDDLDEEGAANCFDGSLEKEDGILDMALTQAEKDAEELEQDNVELVRVKALPDGVRAVAGTKKLLVFCEAVERRLEDGKVIGEKPFKRFYEAHDDGVHRIWETSLKDEMAKNSKSLGLDVTSEISVKYDVLVESVWKQFERDMDNMSARQITSKWQTYFQRRLDRIDRTRDDLASRIERISRFINANMFTDREPYRSLAALSQRLDREAADDETMLAELEKIEATHGDKVHARMVGRPRIVCSMMVG